MELLLLNTVQGLIPMYDADYDEKKKLKIGEAYKAKINLVRNLKFHNKYFALINTAWAMLPESQVAGFRTVNKFREYVEIAAGHSELFYSPKLKDWVEGPKSIAFDKMDNAAFDDLYCRVRTVIDAILAPYISREQFERLLTF